MGCGRNKGCGLVDSTRQARAFQVAGRVWSVQLFKRVNMIGKH